MFEQKFLKITSVGCVMEKLENQPCPFCREKKLTLTEDETEIPFFGKAYLFSMHCNGCDFNKADVEAAEQRDPVKVTFEVANEKDMAVRVVKSSYAAVKVPQLKMEMTPGPASIGFVSNVEGILDRFKDVIESEKEVAEEDEEKKRCKNFLKKIWKVKCGDIHVKIIIEDPSGNSAIISEKAVVEKLKVKKEKEE